MASTAPSYLERKFIGRYVPFYDIIVKKFNSGSGIFSGVMLMMSVSNRALIIT